MKLRNSYWVLPVISGLVWFVMLVIMLAYWVATGREHYDSMNITCTVAYISDIGGSTLKPLFIGSCTVSAILLNISFVIDRWLRYKAQLCPSKTLLDKAVITSTILFAVAGTVIWILLSIIDTTSNKLLYRILLLLFVLGYLLTAGFICWEYRQLSKKKRLSRFLYVSFWIKLAIITTETALAIPFTWAIFTEQWDIGAYLEWVIVFLLSFYIISFAMDLHPAALASPKENVLSPQTSFSQADTMEQGTSVQTPDHLLCLHSNPSHSDMEKD